ncbi:hypothetical protein B4U79_04988 [Dinothrombium tinctorium]|uniref:Uncharacterized protein n=1 Tax=Dinothrombium tinctorium TaxID=1965070 RepID=A0A443QPE9_9ACAR|nr:hypothetical protein B4U79_04988 [Dinothrombium tinctorium]
MYSPHVTAVFKDLPSRNHATVVRRPSMPPPPHHRSHSPLPPSHQPSSFTRMLGAPLPFAHTYDDFDKQTTIDERFMEYYYPLPYMVNPGIRAAVTKFQDLEKTYHKRSLLQKILLQRMLNLLMHPI